MSGIFGLFNLCDDPDVMPALRRMGCFLHKRGPEKTCYWHDRQVGIGHTLLATTPEETGNPQPLTHRQSGCVISADARIDNRNDLIACLGLSQKSSTVCDAELLLLCYLKWGESFVQKILGDYAFAIWDPSSSTMFCARDPFGIRPLFYFHDEKGGFVFASSIRGITTLPQVPYRLNRARIGDFLVGDLESVDFVSTFFERVLRLPPAHCLIVSRERLVVRRFWRFEPQEPLLLPSQAAYAEAFHAALARAVEARLRCSGRVGSMLSGGMDSASIVAHASCSLARSNLGPLTTISAVGRDENTCMETKCIRQVQATSPVLPINVELSELDHNWRELDKLEWELEEPFDDYMTLVRAVYLAARRNDVCVVLDGVGGDEILSEGQIVARQIRRGNWVAANRNAVHLERYWGKTYSRRAQLIGAARRAYIPSIVRRWRYQAKKAGRAAQVASQAFLRPEFASEIGLPERIHALNSHQAMGIDDSFAVERIREVNHPNIVVARERYDRVASALSVESRAPYLDREFVEFCLSLPADILLAGGWPKGVQRLAMNNQLPNDVLWRGDKEHLGWEFTKAVASKRSREMHTRIMEPGDIRSGIESIVDLDRFAAECERHGNDEMIEETDLYGIFQLANWLHQNSQRPQPARAIAGETRYEQKD